MDTYQFFIGIDMGKSTFNYAIRNPQQELLIEGVVKNNPKSITLWIEEMIAFQPEIRKGNIMHDYFNRKVTQGKNKMSVINAVRNKLIHILLACIKNNTVYQKNFNHLLA